MSRSNYDNPFYVDVGTSVVSIRCASNSDVIFEYDYTKCPQVIQFAKDDCDRMNREAEIGRPLRNCDVGTVDEQIKRHRNFCNSNVCKCEPSCKICFAKWTQMPYEERGAE